MSQSVSPTQSSRKFFLSNIFVGIGTLLSRLTGFGRVLALAYAIGLGGLSDVYNTANITPSIIYELMLGGILSATLLPSFVKSLKDNDERSISAVITITGIILFALTIIMICAAPLIMSLYSLTRQDHPAEFHTVGVELIRYFMPQVFFYGLISIATGLLNAQHKFTVPAIAPVLNNLVVICMLLALPHIFQGPLNLQEATSNKALVTYLGLGATLGIITSSLTMVWAVLKTPIKISFVPDWSHPAVQNVLKLSGWTVGYVIANQVALYCISLIAIHREGWVTAYQMAFTFFMLPHGLLAMTITTTFLPKIAADAAANNMADFKLKILQGLKWLILMMAPASVGYMIVAKPLLVTFLNHGQFSLEASHMTAEALSMFAIGLLPFSVYLFLLRGYYALSDTKTPFKLNLVENAINIGLALPLVYILGFKGLSLSYALAYWAAALLTLLALNKRIGQHGPSLKTILPDILKIAGSTAIMAGISFLTLSVLDDFAAPFQLAGAVLTGGISYIWLVLGLRIVSIKDILKK